MSGGPGSPVVEYPKPLLIYHASLYEYTLACPGCDIDMPIRYWDQGCFPVKSFRRCDEGREIDSYRNTLARGSGIIRLLVACSGRSGRLWRLQNERERLHRAESGQKGGTRHDRKVGSGCL